MQSLGCSRTEGGAATTCSASAVGETRIWPSTWSERVAEATVTGVGRIGAAFESARAEGRAALMPYMMGGFPDQESSLAIAAAYVDAGADLIELGVPFSDPLADGPLIHAAATDALAAGATLESTLEVCSSVS